MSRMGDDMVSELQKLLKPECCLEKTAAKKEEKEECEKCEKAPCECKKAKKKKKSKKAEVMLGIVDELAKLADTLDESGSLDAAAMVDDALKVVVANIEEDKTEEFVNPLADFDPPGPYPEPTDEEAENMYERCTCEKGKMCDMCQREAERVSSEDEAMKGQHEFDTSVISSLETLKKQNPDFYEALDYALELIRRK